MGKLVKISVAVAAMVCIFAFVGCKQENRSKSSHTGKSNFKIKAAGMVYVEGGTFQMGSYDDRYADAHPVHQVMVSSFYMGKYEVTQAEYKAIMNNNPSHFKDDNLPVECVSWYDAVKYCNERSKKEGLTSCYTINGTDVTCDWDANGYRLPTEAEWEYAARGGKNNSTYKYSGSDTIDEVAWHLGNSDNTTHKVGTKNANALELYDMSGNVWEWCWDWYSDDYSNSTENNPLGPARGGSRVLRGGSWAWDATFSLCHRRSYWSPENNGRDLFGPSRSGIGFRVVRSAK